MKNNTLFVAQREGRHISNSPKKVGGFTVIELILVILILAVVGTSTLLVFSNQQLGNLESDAEIIASRLAEAQNRALGSIEGRSWGVHFDNTASPFYAVFPGTSYSVASSTYYLSGIVEFQSPASGTSTNVIFEKISGTVSSSVSIVIRLKTDTSKAKTITVSSQGRVTVE